MNLKREIGISPFLITEFSNMKIRELTHFIEEHAPLVYQESYDNSGVIVGNKDLDIKGVLICLDCIEEVVDEAIQLGYNLIIAHHPIIFKGIKTLTGKNYIEKTVIKAIKNDIVIYAVHTNLDNVLIGVNHQIAQKIGLKNIEILSPKVGLLQKLVTYVPLAYADKVRTSLFVAGAGEMGNYSECSFNTKGAGTFKARQGANPFVGSKNTQHIEDEQRIEVLMPIALQKRILHALLQAHPYEKVAYDIFNIENPIDDVGSGVIGDLEHAMTPKDCLNFIKEKMQLSVIKYTNLRETPIKKIALCGGSGSFLLPNAIQKQADMYISADFKYHEYFDAEEKIIIADIGHYESEQFTQEFLFEIITKKFTTFAVQITKINTNPIKYLI